MQMLLNVIADKFAACKDMDMVKKAVEEVETAAWENNTGDPANAQANRRMQTLLNLIADKFKSCGSIDAVKKAVEEVRDMAD